MIQFLLSLIKEQTLNLHSLLTVEAFPVKLILILMLNYGL